MLVLKHALQYYKACYPATTTGVNLFTNQLTNFDKLRRHGMSKHGINNKLNVLTKNTPNKIIIIIIMNSHLSQWYLRNISDIHVQTKKSNVSKYQGLQYLAIINMCVSFKTYPF